MTVPELDGKVGPSARAECAFRPVRKAQDTQGA